MRKEGVVDKIEDGNAQIDDMSKTTSDPLLRTSVVSTGRLTFTVTSSGISRVSMFPAAVMGWVMRFMRKEDWK